VCALQGACVVVAAHARPRSMAQFVFRLASLLDSAHDYCHAVCCRLPAIRRFAAAAANIDTASSGQYGVVTFITLDSDGSSRYVVAADVGDQVCMCVRGCLCVC